ncbi:sodium-dependent transporter [Woodsholea maritima]|uniref:sodium-dependent transporter n=1 Tax=Woodsholea maritima TaxID=240237 RepID=UPI00035DA865|nr:sodium-dependent transporter [Woodsholea maritima]
MALASSGGAGQWSSRFAFIMAAVGSSVGLGNLWRFPYMTGENGGAAFVIVYLLCVVLVGFPIMIAELSVGRHARLSAVGSTRKMAQDAGASPLWSITGWVGMIGAFLILVTYSVVAGWVISYIYKMGTGAFAGLNASEVRDAFQTFTADKSTVIMFHTGFMIATMLIVMRGISGGIEKAAIILMPLFFIMLLGMVGYAFVQGDMGAAVHYLFRPDFGKIIENPNIVLQALGQAFFSLSLGSAIMITYGGFLKKEDNIASSSVTIVGSDTFVAIIAGLAIFPIVFAFPELEPNAGPSLFFEALPTAFAQMPGGNVFGAIFFILAFFAALTSSISLLQTVISWSEEHTDLGKVTSTLIFGTLVWLLGVGAAFSGEFSNFLDFISGSLALPIAGLLIAVFAGWIVSKEIMRKELPQASNAMFAFWRFTIRYPAPIAVSIIIVLGLDATFGWGLSDMIFGGGEQLATD